MESHFIHFFAVDLEEINDLLPCWALFEMSENCASLVGPGVFFGPVEEGCFGLSNVRFLAPGALVMVDDIRVAEQWYFILVGCGILSLLDVRKDSFFDWRCTLYSCLS